jgi:hypothetical protein
MRAVLDVRHVAVTLLHPRYRSLKNFPDRLENQCYRYVRRQVRQLRETADLEDQRPKKPLEPTSKKFKGERSLFSRFESENHDEDTVHDNGSSSGSDEYEFHIKKSDELDRYLLMEIDKTKDVLEPLEFWKEHRNQFLLLSQYARSILSIPATTTNVEREFSTADWILNQRRTSLKSEEVDKILFVRSIRRQFETN